MASDPLSRDRETLRLLLRELRESAGLRQADLAQSVGQPQSFVSKYESGERRLDVGELRLLCRALGTNLPALANLLEERLREA